MTDIPTLPKSWIIARLDEVSEVTQGQSPPGESYNTIGQGPPFLQGKAEFGTMYPTAAKWCSMPTKFAQVGDVLISVRAPVGTTNLADAGYCIGRGLAAIRPLGGIPNRYILYGIRASLEQLTSNATGTTFPAITGDVLRRHALPLPPLAEQRRIVEEIEKQFTRLDAAVEALRTAQAKLKRYRASVLNAAVTGRLVPTEAEFARAEGRAYEPASVLLERIARERAEQERDKPRRKRRALAPVDTSTLPELPEGWAWATLSSIGQVRLGRQRSPNRAVGPNMHPYLRAANVGWNGLNLADVKEMDFTPKEYQNYQLLPGDILLSEASGSADEVGKPAIWNGEIDSCCFQNTLIRVRMDSELVPYVYHHLLSDARSGALGRAARGVGIHHLGAERTEAWTVGLPPLAEQRRIVTEIERRLSTIQQAEATIETNMKRAERLRQAVLKHAFEGRLVPQNSDDEPAAVLLERIKTEKAAAAQERRRRGRSSWKE